MNSSDTSPERSVRAVLDRGDNLRAYDAATALLASDEERPAAAQAELVYLRALALARSGSTERARQELDAPAPDTVATDRRLAEDRAALGARLAKDRALLAPERDPALLAEAAQAYEAVHREFASGYAAVNAATLWLLAGAQSTARDLAAGVRPAAAASADELDRYWELVTEAEAALVLGDVDSARDRIAEAGAVAVDNLGARASTRRQLRLLFDFLDLDATAELAPLRNPAVLHYCGHRVAADDADRFRRDVTPRVQTALERILHAEGISTAHGSLACGADLLIATALIDRGVELHVVLPFDVDEFLVLSVRPGGESWVAEFERCMAAAASVTVTCDSAYLGDDHLFSYGSQVAMGIALNRARLLEASAFQLAVWDGEPGPTAAGTAQDVSTWQRAGGSSTIVPATSNRTTGDLGATVPAVSRPVTAVLFGDIQGFSRLRDEELLRFLPVVWRAVADVIDPLDADIVDRNVWGDAIFLAFSDVGTAARCALRIQHELAQLDLSSLGVPADLHLRLAGHVGPTFTLRDPIRGVDALFGRELTRAARIEPRTPPGAVYVTRAFAALLELEPATGASAEYVGTITTAKGFETIPMFVLRRP